MSSYVLSHFINPQQLHSIRSIDLLSVFVRRVTQIPVVSDARRQDDPIAYLRYFSPLGEWYVTERDQSNHQTQAFGWICRARSYPTMGCINLDELLAHGVKLDLHFEPMGLSAVKRGRYLQANNY